MSIASINEASRGMVQDTSTVPFATPKKKDPSISLLEDKEKTNYENKGVNDFSIPSLEKSSLEKHAIYENATNAMQLIAKLAVLLMEANRDSRQDDRKARELSQQMVYKTTNLRADKKQAAAVANLTANTISSSFKMMSGLAQLGAAGLSAKVAGMGDKKDFNFLGAGKDFWGSNSIAYGLGSLIDGFGSGVAAKFTYDAGMREAEETRLQAEEKAHGDEESSNNQMMDTALQNTNNAYGVMQGAISNYYNAARSIFQPV